MRWIGSLCLLLAACEDRSAARDAQAVADGGDAPAEIGDVPRPCEPGLHGCWLSLTASPLAARSAVSTAWTGSELLLWGGVPRSAALGDFNDGARFAPASGSWTLLPVENRLTGRAGQLTVWTGRKLWIWGGANEDGDSEPARQGILFDVVDDRWAISAAAGIPAGRTSASVVWTGARAIVWGGANEFLPGVLGDGAAYDPVADAWTAISSIGAPSARYAHVAVWTGDRMLVWGGRNGAGLIVDGASYDPVADRWAPISAANAPGVEDGAAFWTGRELLVWDGAGGGAYDPAVDRWRPIATAGAPDSRALAGIVWIGKRMLVWGGYAGGAAVGDGALYDPETDTWIPMSAAGAPTARWAHGMVWTGQAVLVWGGRDAKDVTATGALFVPPGT